MKIWNRLKEALPEHKSMVLIFRKTKNDPIPSGDDYTYDISYYTRNEYVTGFGRAQGGEGLFNDDDIVAWRYIDTDELQMLIDEDVARSESPA